MPYVAPGIRKMLDRGIGPADVGSLTYNLYRECLRYLNSTTECRYKDFAEVLGALEATKQEFYRRKVAPYEDVKIEENGDVL